MHVRSFNAVFVLAVIASLIVAMIGVGSVGLAAPLDATSGEQARNQADEATPSLIEPSDGATPQEAPQQEAGQPDGNEGLLPISIGEGLGNGGQPADLPREIVVGDARYLFDRILPLERQALTRIAQDASLIVYARGETGPFDAVYVSVPNRSEDELARYLPERIEAPDVACPAEAAEIGQLDAGEAVYVFAGFETDLTTETLQEVGSSEGNPVYADPGAGQTLPEVFAASADGLLRFVLAGPDGRPASLAESLAFGGTLFTFVADVTGQIDPATLAKVGCAGPYPVYAEQGADAGNRYVWVGGRLFQFGGEPALVDEPTEQPVVVPTEIPTEAPTAIPTEVPTEAPTAVPTEVPTEAPTEVPTEAPTIEPTEVPTEAPTAVPTEIPTEAPTEIPTEAPTAAPTDVPTEAPTEAVVTEPVTEEPAAGPTQEPVAEATEGPAEAAAEVSTATPAAEQTIPATGAPDAGQSATAAGLPEEVEVQNASYVITQVDVDIDIQTLVEIDVITVNNTVLTVYAEQEFDGVAPVLYCVADEGEVIGRYVPVAATNPTPPPDLPPTIEVENATYVFNQVNVDIDIQTLVEVNVIVVQNVELTIYAEQDVDGQQSRYFAVTGDGEVVGQYVQASLVGTAAQVTPPPTPQLQPPAVVPTQAPDAPPPAAVTAEPAETCAGSPGPIDDQGVPAYLPNRIQLGGIAYALVGTEAPGEAGELTRIGCIGGFEILATDQADRSEVLYLRIAGQGTTADVVYRFEAAVTYSVEFEVTGRPQRISAEEQQFRLTATWQPSIYSSTTAILFVEDVESTAPDVFFAVNVYNTVVGEVVGEYRSAGQNDQPSEAMVTAAENAGINPDLTVEGQRYLLVNVYSPVGTTTNGFVTLFSATGEGAAEILLGRDKRRLELFVYDVIPAEETGG